MTTTSPSTRQAVAPVIPGSLTCLQPLSVTDVTITGGFWAARQHVNAQSTIPLSLEWMERVGWLNNLDAAARGDLPQERRGREFSDSEIYKLLEAMSWQLAAGAESTLDDTIRSVSTRIAAAQEDDGYLNTMFGRPGQQPRYSDLEWGHELYNVGHLLQAAVARLRAGTDDQLVQIAVRAADHVCEVFGGDGRRAVCGHPEIELGLVELARATGQHKYLDQARLFIERRGHGSLAEIEWGRSYYQDDVPIREATVFRGHAVRALYLAAAAVDVATDTGDRELLATIERQWEATVARRTYVTGGMGSHHQDEAFGEDFELPSDRAYCETCAGVASIMLSWRLLLATGNPRYADLIERTLFNVVATSQAPDGRSFFYSNTLHQRTPTIPADPDEVSLRASSGLRAPWFEVSCCPTNLARTFASLTGYLASMTAAGIDIHQYSESTVRTTLPDGGPVRLSIHTAYPTDGVIDIVVEESPAEPWELGLRVPAWAEDATLEVDGLSRPVSPGRVAVARTFTAGDRVRLTLPIRPKWTFPNARIDAIRGTAAVQVGPLVYALESIDLPGHAHVDRFVAHTSQNPTVGADGVFVTGHLEHESDREWPYTNGPEPSTATQPLSVALTPYHAWADRGPSTMRVWMRTTAASDDIAQDDISRDGVLA